MIRFFYGGGSKKTRDALISAITADIAAGKKVILLVPEQETVVTERRMLAALSPAAQLSFEVLNFTRLANRTFRTVGGLGYRYATPAVSTLLMWRTLRELAPTLSLYGAHAANDPRLCAHMLSAVTELQAYCVTPDMLGAASKELKKGEPLADKLLDLEAIYAHYTATLSALFDDMKEDITRATVLIRQNEALFADTHLYVDSFTDFTAAELALLRVLMARTPTASFCLPLATPRDDGIHLAAAKETHKKLQKIAKELGKQIFTIYDKATKPENAIDYLRRDLFDMSAEPLPLGILKEEKISLLSCASPFAEAEFAASLIARLVREGYRYSDVALVVRDTAAWSGIIDAALEKEGIPYYLAERTDVTVKPLVSLILFALRIKEFNFRKEDVVALLKTGLLPIPQDDINFFEEYVQTWRFGGKAQYVTPFTRNPDGYSERVSERGARILAGANRAREAMLPPLLAFFDALDSAQNATAMCRALDNFLRTLQIPDTLKKIAAARLDTGSPREATELSRLFAVTLEAMEAISLVLGGEGLTVRELREALQLVFVSTDIGTIPTSADEVTVGSAATLRADRPRVAIVLGLNEGSFPKTVTDKGLLTDSDKQRLTALGISLSADNATEASSELFYVYRALTLPSERLFATLATTTASGGGATPSIAASRLAALLGTKIKDLPRFEDTPLAARLYSPEVALEHYGELDRASQRALLDLLADKKALGARARALETPVVDTAAAIDKSEADTLFTPDKFNPSGIEKFVSCKFAYYCSKILSLREEPTDALGSNVVGIFVHSVLETVITAAKKQGKSYADFSDAQTDELVAAAIATYRARLIEAGGDLSPRAEALVSRLALLARLIIRSLFAELSDSKFSPALLEFDLKREADTALIGNSIPLSGKADRVDVYRAENGDAYLRVVDYKTGVKDFHREDIEKGFDLQMPLYLYALTGGVRPRLAEKLRLPTDTVFRPAGISYFSAAVGSERTPKQTDSATAFHAAVERLVRTGIVSGEPEIFEALSASGNKKIVGDLKKAYADEDFAALFADLEKTVTRISGEMKSGRADIAPTPHRATSPCNICAFGAVCRAAQKTRQG